MKTNKAAARRFKITGTGKILRTQSGKRHINEWMPAKVKRKLRGKTEMEKSQKQNVLNYSRTESTLDSARFIAAETAIQTGFRIKSVWRQSNRLHLSPAEAIPVASN